MEVVDNNKEEKTLRIRINTNEQPRPVVFNYRQLCKREQKKQEELPKDFIPPATLDAGGDDFYEELLRKAEAYAMVDNDDEEDDEEENTALEMKRGDEYDYEDPFIDDSEMFLDEPHEYSAPEFDGFFVYHGPLDGHEGDDKKPKRKAPAKPRNTTTTNTNKRGNTTNTGATTTAPRNKKTATDDPQEEPSAKKKALTPTALKAADNKKKTITPTTAAKASPVTAVTKTPTTTVTKPATPSIKRTSSMNEQPSKKKKKLEDEKPISIASSGAAEDPVKKKDPPALKPLDAEVEILMEKLKRDVKLESFENKSKFPLSLKPTVLEIGLITFRKYKTIDDNLVTHLMAILPYNRFTLKKFLTTKSGQMRVDELQQEIDELAILLKQTIDRMMPEQRRLFNEKVAQAQAQAQAQAHVASENPDEEEEKIEPKFKCNDEVRRILYDIIQTEEHSIHISNQVALHKDPEKKAEGLASDNKARKLMYQRLLSCWPEGWMNSYEMSRQYSQYKTKVSSQIEKKAAANNIPSTPKANIASVDTNNKKRKRVADERKITDSNKSTPESSNPPKQQKLPTQVITIDTDDDADEPVKPWKPSNSMKIESLISSPSQKKL